MSEQSDNQTPLPRKVQSTCKWLLLTPGQQQAIRDMEARGISRVKQLSYFAECMRKSQSSSPGSHNAPVTWTERGLSEFWQGERDHEAAVLASIRRTRAVAADILAGDKQSGISLEEATGKKLLSIWTMIADALVDATSPEGLALLEKATNGIAALSQAPHKKAELAQRREALKLKESEIGKRFATKIEAGLKAIEADVAKNPQARAAIDALRKALKGDA